MTPIDLGGGMIFPDRYDRDQDDGPDPCDECDGTGRVPMPFGADWPSKDGQVECDVCRGTGQVG